MAIRDVWRPWDPGVSSFRSRMSFHCFVQGVSASEPLRLTLRMRNTVTAEFVRLDICFLKVFR